MSDRLPYRSKDGHDSNRDDDEEGEDEEIDEAGYKTVKDAVLFSIEVSTSMLKKPSVSGSGKADTDSPLLAALKSAYHLIQQRIISNPKDLIGILLYGTEASKFYEEEENSRGGWSYPHCYLLIDLDIPEAQDVKVLKRLVEDNTPEADEIFQPSREPVSMHNMLFCANQIFQQRAANFISRRLFIVTDNDDPHTSNKAFRSQATVRAKDLYDLGVVIELFPISTTDHVFDTKLFYDDIVYKSTPSDPEAVLYNPASVVDADSSKLKAGSTDGISLLQSLLNTIASKITPKRALFSVPLELAPNFRISVKGYLLYKHQTPARSCYIYLGSERPQIVKGSRTQTSDSDSREVQKADIRKAYNFGGEQVTFSEEEAKKLRDFGEPIIRVVGFKPLSILPLWANLKNSTFLYPSEEDYIGSTRVYSALFQKLAKDKIFGLCWFVPRRNATPVMAAMITTLSAPDAEEKRSSAGVSATGAPQGLHLIPLPFADDIRQNPPNVHATPLRAPDELVDAMRPLVQQLNLPKGIYDPSKYPNPSLQWHYHILQALALQEDLPEKPVDKTQPKYRQIDKRVGSEAIKWGITLDKAYKEFMDDNPDAVNVGIKRATNGSAVAGGAALKKVKMEAGEVISEEDLRKLWQKQQIESLTVAQLKDFCVVKKLPMGGKKADIVENIERWLETR